jgi:hypothetical protein
MFDLRATVGALEGFYDEALRPPESSRD